MPSQLAAIYNAAPIILWVEDQLTATYLDALWRHDRRIKMYIGGGHETLKAVIEDALRSGHRNVFALRDRDFGPTNRPRWSASDLRVFVLETFEVECFLLDPPALARCDVNTAARDETWIRTHLRQFADRQLWWMACRTVIAQLREDRQLGFPSHPKPHQISTREEAQRVGLDNEWCPRPRRVSRTRSAHVDYTTHWITPTPTTKGSGPEPPTTPGLPPSRARNSPTSCSRASTPKGVPLAVQPSTIWPRPSQRSRSTTATSPRS